MNNDEQPPLETFDDQPGSVSNWVCNLKDGDASAAQQLWDRYFAKLIAHAKHRVRAYNCPEGIVIPEDIAISVFESIWRSADAGRFQKVTDRDELWWLLQAMTRRKVINHIRHATALRRFPGKIPISLSSDEPEFLFGQLVSEEPTAEDVVMMEEQYSHLLSLLRDDTLRKIAVNRIEGLSHDEICQKLGISMATIVRKLKLIRDTWKKALQDEGPENGST